jgi:U4/U6.U5 tri-snRNP-associated protein 2
MHLCSCFSLCCRRVQVEDVWYEVQDLRVTDVLPQMVALSETYLQVYELKQ